jgi:hypothetical protein
MIIVETISKSCISGYDAYISTKKGKRYYINWATEPTKEEVIDAWREDKKWFVHIN